MAIPVLTDQLWGRDGAALDAVADVQHDRAVRGATRTTADVETPPTPAVTA